jgi:hypothetical protein
MKKMCNKFYQIKEKASIGLKPQEIYGLVNIIVLIKNYCSKQYSRAIFFLNMLKNSIQKNKILQKISF